MAGDGGAELGRIIWVENFEYTSSRTHVVANILSNFMQIFLFGLGPTFHFPWLR